MPLEPPKEGKFDSRDELFNSAQSHAQSEGYAVVTRSSRKGLLYLQCDKGGQYKNCRNLTEETRKRKPNSKLTGCPFMLRGKEIENEEWQLTVLESDHNHPPSSNVRDHSILRRLNQEQKLLVLRLRECNLKPAEIVNHFKVNNLPPITIKDVHNINKKTKPKEFELDKNYIPEALSNFENLIASFSLDGQKKRKNDDDESSSSSMSKRQTVRCSRCHQTGHTRAHPDCPSLSSNEKQSNETHLPIIDFNNEQLENELANWSMVGVLFSIFLFHS